MFSWTIWTISWKQFIIFGGEHDENIDY